MIRLALVIGHLGRGGAERQLYELVVRLNRDIFDPVVFCLSERVTPFGDYIRSAGLPLITIKNRLHYDPTRILLLSYYFVKFRIQLIHSFLHIANGYAYFASQISGLNKVITSLRNCEIDRPKLHILVDKINLKQSNRVVVNSQQIKDFAIRRFDLDPEKVSVVHNGIDLTRFETVRNSAVRKKLLRNENARVVGTVGRFEPQKDFASFLHVAKRVIEHSPMNVEFILAGEGPLLEEVKQLAHELDIARFFHFLGARDDVHEIMNLMDVFVLTSYKEGLPNVIMEAMASAKPVVATDVGGCRELVEHGASGYLVSHGEVERMADYIVNLLKNKSLAKKMGAAGHNRMVQEFTVSRMVEQYERLYLDVFHGGKN